MFARYLFWGTGYTVFAGALEVLGGVLLLFRRTQTVGALVIGAVMTNVVMLNLCYDVPVKLLSSHLLVMSVFIIAPEARRLFDTLVLGRAAEAIKAEASLFRKRWARRTALGLKVAFVLYTGHDIVTLRLKRHAMGDGAPRPAMFGIYQVDSLVRNGEEIPPLLTNGSSWRHIVIDHAGTLTIIRMNGSKKRYNLAHDVPRRTFTLTSYLGASHTLEYSELSAGLFEVTGQVEDQLVTFTIRRDERGQLLTNRGFNWVQEAPFNR